MINIFLRTTILYFISVFIIRIMGKRQIGELQPHELVMTFMISDLASLSMADTRLPLLLAVIPIATLAILKTIITEIELKSPKFRRLLDGTPSLIIKKGILQKDVIKKEKINIDDLLEETREKGYFDINEIDYALLENNGDISILPKDGLVPVQKVDLGIHVDDKVLPEILFFDGKVQKENLNKIDKDLNWLKSELSKLGFNDMENLYLVIQTTKKELFVQENPQRKNL